MASLLLRWRLAPCARTDGQEYYGAKVTESTDSRYPGEGPPSGPTPQPWIAGKRYHRLVQDLPSFRINEIFLSVQGRASTSGNAPFSCGFTAASSAASGAISPSAHAHRRGRVRPDGSRAGSRSVLAYPSARRVCLTGGEPVVAPTAGLLWLVRELKASGYGSRSRRAARASSRSSSSGSISDGGAQGNQRRDLEGMSWRRRCRRSGATWRCPTRVDNSSS